MKFLFILLFALFAFPVFSQNLPANDFQSWNDVTISKPLIKSKDSRGKEFERLTIFFTGASRLGNNFKNLVDQRIGVGFDYKVNKFLTLTPNYFHRSGKPRLNVREYENRFRFAATFEKKWTRFSLKDRNLIEYRLRNSRADSTRYRNKLTFSLPILKNKKEIFSTYLADDVFYEITTKSWTRNEFTAGISRKLTNNLGVDVFYLRQDNRSGLPKSVNAIGVSWKIKLD